MHLFDQLGDLITDAMPRFRVPGVAVGILHEGEEYTAGFGVTSVEHPLSVDAGTLFQIGSVSKTFTATLAMRLVEEGRLDLDAPVRKYLPDLRLADESVAARVTVRHLFIHTGGWLGDYFDDFGPGADALAQYVARMVELPQLTPLGAVWAYNNAAFALAGRVLEVVTGQSYEDALRHRVLAPLALNDTFLFPSDAMTHRFVVGHNVDGDEVRVARPWALARAATPIGGVISNVKELLRYARFHMSDGEGVLSRGALNAMQSPLATAALGDEMGLSWFLRNRGDMRTAGHGGATNGQQCDFTFAPQRGFALCILTNSNRGAALIREVSQWVWQQYFGIAPTELQLIAKSAEELASFVGRYTSLLADIELTLRDGEFVLQSIPKGGFPKRDSPPMPTPPPTRLAFCGEDRVVALDDPFKDLQGEFLRSTDGSIEWFRFGGRIRARE